VTEDEKEEEEKEESEEKEEAETIPRSGSWCSSPFLTDPSHHENIFHTSSYFSSLHSPPPQSDCSISISSTSAASPNIPCCSPSQLAVFCHAHLIIHVASLISHLFTILHHSTTNWMCCYLIFYHSVHFPWCFVMSLDLEEFCEGAEFVCFIPTRRMWGIQIPKNPSSACWKRNWGILSRLNWSIPLTNLYPTEEFSFCCKFLDKFAL
jgi:hypothetical protein